MNQDMQALIHRPRKQRYSLVADEQGRGQIVRNEIAAASGDAGENQPARRVVEGTADGGKGREDPPRPTKMNQLVRELAFGAYARKMRQGG